MFDQTTVYPTNESDPAATPGAGMCVIGIGELLWDLFPDGASLGGAPFNLIAHARQLGHPVAYVSAVGRDDLGERALQEAARLGLATDLIARVPGLPTGTVAVHLGAKGIPDFEILRPAAYDAVRLTKSDIDRVAGLRPGAIAFGTLAQTSPEVRRSTRALVEACPAALRLYDVNLRKDCWDAELVRELARWASIIKLNAAEVSVIAPIFDLPSVPIAYFARSLASRLELRSVCITLGEHGAALWLDGTYAEARAPAVTVADTVGAGDAFAAALVDGILRQLPAIEVLTRANALGSLVASKRGAIPDWTIDELHHIVTTTRDPLLAEVRGGARGRPTMKDVAALARVSLKTVSRVINAEPAVSEEVRSRVVGAIHRLDYRHNHAASSLRRSDRKSSTIGVLLEDVADPSSAALQREIEDVALERGVLVLAGSSDGDEAREQQLIAAFMSRRVDGIIIVSASHDHSYLVSERRAGTPMVFVDRPPAFFDADSVLTDNQAGVRRGVAHLIAHGHRRIGYLGDLMTITPAAQRYRGYEEELTATGIAIDPQLVRLNVHGIERAEAAALELLTMPQPPTALFTSQDRLTIGASRALHRLDLHQRIGLVGFEDVLLADLLEPGITVVAQDPSAMGREAAEHLFRRIDGDQSSSVHLVVPMRLITRGSGEISP